MSKVVAITNRPKAPASAATMASAMRVAGLELEADWFEFIDADRNRLINRLSSGETYPSYEQLLLELRHANSEADDRRREVRVLKAPSGIKSKLDRAMKRGKDRLAQIKKLQAERDELKARNKELREVIRDLRALHRMIED